MKIQLSVPIQLFIKAQQKGFKNELSVFLLLKLLYPSGKTKLDNGELIFIELMQGIRSRKTTRRYVKKLLMLGCIVYNSKTHYYILKAFDRIREENGFKSRLAFPIGYHNYNKLNAVTGAIIYGYLHKDFWRKVKREKSVQIKGRTYNFPSITFNYKKSHAPVSVYGVQQIFDIPVSSASRIKKAAKKEKYINIKSNYKKVSNDEAATLKVLKRTHNLRFKQGSYYLQSIDAICPLFYFVKRKSLV